MFCLEPHQQSTGDMAWRTVQQSGDIPSGRPAQSCLVWGEQLWLYGCGSGSEAGHVCEEELHRFDFMSRTWSKSEQLGCLPDRDLLKKTAYRGFHPIVTYGESVPPWILSPNCKN